MTETVSEKKQNPWIIHCKAYMLEHKCNYKEAIKLSRETYQKQPKKEVEVKVEVPIKKIRKVKTVKKVKTSFGCLLLVFN